MKITKRILPKLAMFATGAIASAGFAPYHWLPLSFLGLGFAYWAIRGAHGFWNGYAAGFWWGAGYTFANFRWNLTAIFVHAEVARQAGWMYPIGIVLFMVGGGLIFGTAFAMTAASRSSGWRRAVCFALSCAAVLWLRERFISGMNPLANIALSYPAVSEIMSITGALGLTFILAGAIAAIPEYIQSKSKPQFLFFVPLIIFPLIPSQPFDPARDYYIRTVQPSFDMNRKMDEKMADQNVAALTELSKSAGDDPAWKPDLIVWPETSYSWRIWDDTQKTKMALGVPTVVGATYTYEDPETFRIRLHNAMVLLDKDGNVVDKYFKRYLAPFFEAWPFGLSKVIPIPWSLVEAGEGPARMVGNFAPAICYEIAFSDALVANDPDFILNIANDAWVEGSRGIEQNLDMARRQAIETGLPVVRAGYSGISAVIDGTGKVVKSLPFGMHGVMDAKVPPKRMTTYRRIGLDGVMLAIVILCAAILFPARFIKRAYKAMRSSARL